jgi:demethylmenaquinone methyltransferase/2-methoxy-6-polyprenyl-1,4-benzoquinol methylase
MNRDIQRIFSEVNETYERVNHLITLGLDAFWRRRAANAASLLGGSMWLDVCTGTGDMASRLARLADNGTKIIGCDFSMPMIGKAKAKDSCAEVEFVLSEAEALPFPDGTFDLVTISFSTRNLNTSRSRLVDILKEFLRVLKPGGNIINLETSRPPNAFVDRLFRFYVGTVVKPVGFMMSGSRRGYAYLSSTIPEFYGAEELAEIMKEAGFDEVSFNRMTFGAAAYHIGKKANMNCEEDHF